MKRLSSSDSVYIVVVLTPIVLLIALFIYYPAVDTFGQSLTQAAKMHISAAPQKPSAWTTPSSVPRDTNSGSDRRASFKVVLIRPCRWRGAVAVGIPPCRRQRFPGAAACAR